MGSHKNPSPGGGHKRTRAFHIFSFPIAMRDLITHDLTTLITRSSDSHGEQIVVQELDP